MIRLGVCTGLENAGIIAGAGFDYIETALNGIAAMSGEEFQRALEALSAADIPCEAVNCMLPGDLPVTGPEADAGRVRDYLGRAFHRAGELGAKVAVFGSGASRGVPEGASYYRAWQQIMEFLRLAGAVAGEHGLKIAIEPLSRSECNIVNYVSEALALAAAVGLPNVGVLGDTYHMAENGDPLESLSRAGERLWHLHTACPEGRAFPREGDPACRRGDYDRLFAMLGESGYRGRVSVEGASGDLDGDCRGAFSLLDGLRRLRGSDIRFAKSPLRTHFK